jgi:hypothetical protein
MATSLDFSNLDPTEQLRTQNTQRKVEMARLDL